MKQKNSFNTSKKFNKHHHHEEFLLYKNINEKEALCPSCNHHPLGRHKIRIPHHCTEKLCHCKLSRLEAKTHYFKWFMKERRNQIGYSYTFLMAKGSNQSFFISSRYYFMIVPSFFLMLHSFF